MLDVPKNADKSHADGKILQSAADGVGIITFSNPEKRNACRSTCGKGSATPLIELRDDPDIRVVILTGAGDKAFVSGADISQFEKTRHNAEASEEYSKRSAAQRALLADYPKPIIACIRGFCLGGGMQVAMAADIRIASDNSQFGIPAAKLGIAYGYDGLKNLVSLVGPSWARLLMYTGMRIDAAEAVRIGLVDRVVPDTELWNATSEIARTISGNAPLAIKAAKITIAQVLKDSGDRDMGAIKKIGTDLHGFRRFSRGPPRLHGKAQAAIHREIVSEPHLRGDLGLEPEISSSADSPVQPSLQKYFLFPSDPNHRRISCRPVPFEGRLAIVTDAGRDAVDVEVLLTRALKRTAKTCGPDASTLASKFAEKTPQATEAKKPDLRGERGISRKPLRGDAG